MKEVAALHTELRSLLQGPKNRQGWEAIKDVFWQLYPNIKRPASTASPELLAQVEEEVMPALERALDQGWPARLRVATAYDHPRIKRLSRVLHVDGDRRHFGSLHKLTYKTSALSKKQIAELLPLWTSGASFEGFVLAGVDNHHWVLLDALVKASGGVLRHLRWEGVRAPVQSKPYRSKIEELEIMMDQLITAHGATLESFGASWAGSLNVGDVRSMYGPILRRAGELVALKALRFTHVPLGEQDIFDAMMASPALDRLEELSFDNDLAPSRARVLMKRAASVNLRRIGVGYLNYYNDSAKLDPRTLLSSPNLSHVEAWDIREHARDDDGWETPEAAIWRAEQAPQEVREERQAHALDEEVVDLKKYDAAQTRAILFDGEGLRGSTRLKALRVAALKDADVAAIRDGAHEAWPNLECLVFMRSMKSKALYGKWRTSPLLDQLTFLDWSAFDDPPNQQMRDVRSAPDAQQLEARLAMLREALDEALHPFMAYRRWQVVKYGVTRQPDRVAVARALGMEGELSKDSYALMSACEARFIALRGGEQRMLLNGPTYAYSQGDTLQWPYPSET
jgi:hypothetical protein